MEARSIPANSDIALATTSARQTPTPPRATRFGEVLSNTVVQSAESVMRTLPGSPVMAVAIRSATGPGSLGVPMTNLTSLAHTPEGPLATTSPTAGASSIAAGLGSGVAAAGDSSGGIQSSLQQSQDMNLYYLQIQEQVNAENRSYTTLSNVLKAQHDTVKNAIGNIR
jgi:hypothetical protein